MTIEESIKHCKEVAELNRNRWKNCPAEKDTREHLTCEQCAEEHEQLAEWLEELVVLRKAYELACDNYVSESKDFCYECFSETCTHQCTFYNQCGNAEIAESYFIGCAIRRLKEKEESSDGRD